MAGESGPVLAFIAFAFVTAGLILKHIGLLKPDQRHPPTQPAAQAGFFMAERTRLMHLSEKGAAFVAQHEGTVTRAYRDPVGVITIGTGFTNRSEVFSAYWRGKHGRGLRMGDSIGRQESLQLLPKVANEEYGAAVNREIRPTKQHHYDGATSACYNLGPRAAKWRWGVALRDGKIATAARILANNYNTARGRRLPGLVRRRREEAAVIQFADYGHIAVPVQPDDELMAYQRHLKTLGHDPGPIDGLDGEQTRAAVLAFQSRHPDLVNDGILGRASRAQIDREIAAKQQGVLVGVGGAGAVVVSVAQDNIEELTSVPLDWLPWVAGAVVLIGLALVGKRYWPEFRNMIDRSAKP
jgi:GH24 family phage-related lysozyme (muramidase)